MSIYMQMTSEEADVIRAVILSLKDTPEWDDGMLPGLLAQLDGQQRDVIILRGIPGSGKSTRVALLLRGAMIAGRSNVCVSADHFFEDPESGRYSFNPKLLGRAHTTCFDSFKTVLNQRVSVIVVDNTNTKVWEMKKYIDAALEAGYNVRVEELRARDDSDIKRFHNRGLHNVPLDKMRQMHARWEQLMMEHPSVRIVSLEVRQ